MINFFFMGMMIAAEKLLISCRLYTYSSLTNMFAFFICAKPAGFVKIVHAFVSAMHALPIERVRAPAEKSCANNNCTGNIKRKNTTCIRIKNT